MLNFGRKSEHAYNLSHPGPGDPLPICDIGLGSDLAGVELALPLDGLTEELDHPRFPESLG
jgi:hypothetical protein